MTARSSGAEGGAEWREHGAMKTMMQTVSTGDDDNDGCKDGGGGAAQATTVPAEWCVLGDSEASMG